MRVLKILIDDKKTILDGKEITHQEYKFVFESTMIEILNMLKSVDQLVKECLSSVDKDRFVIHHH
jgi:hypothetical protein